jgi:tyrosine-protein kinase Etk/Wzc
VSKAGTVGDVRILDQAAVSRQAVGMKAPAVLAVAALLGLIASLGVVWSFARCAWWSKTPKPSNRSSACRFTPPSPTARKRPPSSAAPRAARRRTPRHPQPEDDAIESLRGLRTTIHFALMDAPHNSLLITGSSPGLGKSFISKNLGAVLANAGQRIVIIDADLRKGHINKEFGLRRETGVSEYVVGSVKLEDIVKPTSVPNLWVVTTGQIPPNPSELLMHQRFEQLLEQLASSSTR